MMFGISEKTVARLKEQYPVGTRVELVSMNDPYNTKLVPGSRGTVRAVDDIGTIHVAWDCGSSLGVAYGEDSCKKLDSVTVICYGDTKVWDSRAEAEQFFLEGMCACEGAEKERYTNVYLDLKSGKTVCRDTYDEEN